MCSAFHAAVIGVIVNTAILNAERVHVRLVDESVRAPEHAHLVRTGAVRALGASTSVDSDRFVISRTLSEEARASEGSPWPLFKGNALGKLYFVEDSDACGTCAGVPMSELIEPSDAGVGCQEIADHPWLPCDVDSKDKQELQAGGHPGTFYVLQNDRIAKQTLAFTMADDENNLKEEKVLDSRREWNVYMEMWCLKRLEKRQLLSKSLPLDVAKLVQDHPLRPFALGENPWAPDFHGVCMLSGKYYLVMENLLAPFKQPCQLDLKLGYRTAEPDKFTFKRFRQQVGDALSPTYIHGARLAGYKIWNPFEDRWHKMKWKALSPLQPLDTVFDKFLDWSGYVGSATLGQFRESLLGMHAWWSKTGNTELNAVALSALMIRECAPRAVGSITIGDIHMRSMGYAGASNASGLAKSELVDFNPGKGTYIAVEASAKRSLYPQHLEEKKYSARSKEAGFPTSTFVTSETIWDNNQWNGAQFHLKYSGVTDKLIVRVYNKIHYTYNLTDYMHIGKDGQAWSTISIPLESGEHCQPIPRCPYCKDKTQPQLCMTITKTPYAPEAVPRRMDTVVKLIDFAHFFQMSETPDWPEDGVDRGLMKAVSQFSRKLSEKSSEGRDISAAVLVGKEDAMLDISGNEGQHMKCEKTGEEPALAKASCEWLAVHWKKKYMSWKPFSKVPSIHLFDEAPWIDRWFNETDLGLGECRVCDELVSTHGGWFRTHGAWQVFKRQEWHHAQMQ